MQLVDKLRTRVKAARRRGARWVRLFDVVRLLGSAEGRGQLWARIAYGSEVHQTTPYTRAERYPELFDLAARLAPHANRILSFGCSTGEELISLRRRFPKAEIIGTEINPRSRRIAARRLAADSGIVVLDPRSIEGSFDVVLALAVLQREPHKIVEMDVRDLSAHYPFERFDSAMSALVERLRAGGLLCVAHAQYRVEDSSITDELEPIGISPRMERPLFGRNGRRLEQPLARTMFRKRGASASSTL